MSPKFDSSTFPLVNKFTRCKFRCYSSLLFIIFNYFIRFLFLKNCLTFKILPFSVIPMAANAHLSKERINTLIAARVLHLNSSSAPDLDSICTVEAMQCLVRYALRPSFSELALAAAIRLAKEKIHQLEFSVNERLDIATKSNVNFYVSRTPKDI